MSLCCPEEEANENPGDVSLTPIDCSIVSSPPDAKGYGKWPDVRVCDPCQTSTLARPGDVASSRRWQPAIVPRCLPARHRRRSLSISFDESPAARETFSSSRSKRAGFALATASQSTSVPFQPACARHRQPTSCQGHVELGLTSRGHAPASKWAALFSAVEAMRCVSDWLSISSV